MTDDRKDGRRRRRKADPLDKIAPRSMEPKTEEQVRLTPGLEDIYRPVSRPRAAPAIEGTVQPPPSPPAYPPRPAALPPGARAPVPPRRRPDPNQPNQPGQPGQPHQPMGQRAPVPRPLRPGGPPPGATQPGGPPPRQAPYRQLPPPPGPQQPGPPPHQGLPRRPGPPPGQAPPPQYGGGPGRPPQYGGGPGRPPPGAPPHGGYPAGRPPAPPGSRQPPPRSAPGQRPAPPGSVPPGSPPPGAYPPPTSPGPLHPAGRPPRPMARPMPPPRPVPPPAPSSPPPSPPPVQPEVYPAWRPTTPPEPPRSPVPPPLSTAAPTTDTPALGSPAIDAPTPVSPTPVVPPPGSPAAPTPPPPAAGPLATPVAPASPAPPALPDGLPPLPQRRPRHAVPEASQTSPSSTEPGETGVDQIPRPADSPAPATGRTADTVLPAPAGTVSGAATALSAPTMLTPIVVPGRRDGAPDTLPSDTGGGEPPASAPPAADEPDPEQVLADYQWRFHPDTLREIVENPEELRELRDRLTEKLDRATDHPTRARLLSLRAVVSRILGELGKAFADGKLALTHAEATGQLRRIAIAQARLAHVLQWRGDFAEADRLFALANSPELPDRLRATMHEHAGRSCYDQGRYIEACNHFEHSLDLRKVEDPDLIERTDLALDAVARKMAENGVGPYPRSREEILLLRRPPAPTFDEQAGAWGYADADGELVIAPTYADVQPFRDSVAWVRRQERQTWELIDESGQLQIDAGAGWLGVGSFSDGLAWVSRDGSGNWIAIDKTNRVVISTGFDDVRPFRRGVAPVRRGGWGAVDKIGRVVVPFQYVAYVTALTDGRYIDGFTDEGLAIVDTGGRKAVVDRSGRLLVPPAHPDLVIHPVAFLISNQARRWGALDRRGEPLIEPNLPSRLAVIEEIDRLLADTKPVI